MKVQQRGEQLIVRLPANETHPLLWLHARADGTIAAQGQFSSDHPDPAMATLFASMSARVLVPASECVCHEVTLPPQARRRALQVAPFMLEDRLATDIDRLHFVVLDQQGDCAHILAVEKSLMHHWLARCERLGLRVNALLPDALMLPQTDDGWHAVQLDDQWLFRRTRTQGMAIDTAWLADFFHAWSEPVVIHCYCAPPTAAIPNVEWKILPPQPLLQLAAERQPERSHDLRQGAFRPQRAWQPRLRPWRTVIYALAVYLTLLIGDAGLKHYQLWQQAEHWRQESVRVYRQLRPQEKNVINPRVQLQQHLNQQASSTQTASLNTLLQPLQPFFERHQAVRLLALAYDAKRAEIRLEVQANTYPELEAFQQEVARHYRLQPGEMKQGQQRVNSHLTLGLPP